MRFFTALRAWLAETVEPGSALVLCGDLNVALDPNHATPVVEALRESIRPHVLGAKLLGASNPVLLAGAIAGCLGVAASVVRGRRVALPTRGAVSMPEVAVAD